MHSQSRSRDCSGKTRHRSWTLTSDSDVLNDLSDEVTSHSGCWLIPVAVEGIKTLALINTGASVMMMGHPLYEKIQSYGLCILRRKRCLSSKELEGTPYLPWEALR